MKKKAAATHEQEQAVIWAICRGHRTIESIPGNAYMTVEQVETAIDQLNVESMKTHGKPFVSFEEAVQ